MAIGDNDGSDNDQFTDYSGVSANDSEEGTDEEDCNDNENTLWSNSILPNVSYEYPQFAGGARGPVKPVITFLECCQLYLTDKVVALVIQETNRMLGMKGTKRNRQGLGLAIQQVALVPLGKVEDYCLKK
jgi:hypothetical protein